MVGLIGTCRGMVAGESRRESCLVARAAQPAVRPGMDDVAPVRARLAGRVGWQPGRVRALDGIATRGYTPPR